MKAGCKLAGACVDASLDLMSTGKPRLVGLNHTALEVGDVDEALRFYEAVIA